MFFPAIFFILVLVLPCRSDVTITIESSRQWVKFVEALLTKLPGTFDIVTAERDWGVGMIDCWFSTADAEFVHLSASAFTTSIVNS